MFLLQGFPCGSAGKESTCNAGDLGSSPGSGRSPGERKGYPLQYSGLENSIDCIVHGVAESDTTKRLTLSLFYYKTKAKLMNIYKVYLRASVSVSLLVVSGSLRPHEL